MSLPDLELCRTLCSHVADAVTALPDKRRAAGCDATIAVAKALARHKNDAALAQQACRALANVASGDAACKAKLLSDGSLEAVATAYAQHVDAAAATFQATRVLANMACGDRACKGAVLRCDGVSLVTTALAVHAADGAVVNAAVACVANLAADDATRAAVTEARGAQMVSDALARHRAAAEAGDVDWSAGLATHCARALANLGAGEPASLQEVQRCGAGEAVASCLRQHGADAMELAAWGCRLLANVSANETGEAQLMRANAPMLVAGLLSAHGGSASVQAEGLACLSNLAAAADPACRGAVVDAGGAAAAVAALEALPRVAPVCEQAMALLSNLARGDARCQAAALQARAPAVVVQRMRANVAATGVQRFGCRLLAALAGGTAASREALVQAGALVAVCRGLDHHLQASQLQSEGCLCLTLIAGGDDACLAALRNSDAANVLKRALKAHPDHANIRETASIFKDALGPPARR